MTPRRKPRIATLPIEVDARALPPLGMPPAEFLRDYWQKKPLLVRNAYPGLGTPIEPEDLAGLACEEGTLSRLVAHDRDEDRWMVRHGPFDEALFPQLGDHDWTLLVQDDDKWDADVAALLPAFGFLPRWRIDDVMVSFAATGGSVGAHVDQYDVFLLQAHGRRRWQVDTRPGAPLDFRDDVELRLLRHFDPDHDWVLAPGDMLYLPPGAANDTMTSSIRQRGRKPNASRSAAMSASHLSTSCTSSVQSWSPSCGNNASSNGPCRTIQRSSSRSCATSRESVPSSQARPARSSGSIGVPRP